MEGNKRVLEAVVSRERSLLRIAATGDDCRKLLGLALLNHCVQTPSVAKLYWTDELTREAVTEFVLEVTAERTRCSEVPDVRCVREEPLCRLVTRHISQILLIDSGDGREQIVPIKH